MDDDKDDDTGTGKNNPPVTPPTNNQEEDDQEQEEREQDKQDGLDTYNITFDTATPAINNPVDLIIQLVPDDTTPSSYAKNLTILIQKRSGTKWTAADASDYTLTIPTVAATFTKAASRSKVWDSAIVIKTA